MRYDVFISYSQAADSHLAERVQDALARFAKPWWRRRALSVFRDETGLTANPGLWSSIANALDNSRYLLLLASPEAAASGWVAREVEHWRARRGNDGVLVALADGKIVWADGAHDFDWQATTALGAACAGMFAEAPRYVDMSWARDASDLDLTNVRFRDQIAQLAAPVRGMRREELVKADELQYRRTLRRAAIAGIAFVVLTVAAVGSIATALTAAQRSRDSRRDAAAARHLRDVAERARDAAVDEKNDAVDEKNAAVQEKDAAVDDKNAAVHDKDVAVGEKNAAVSEKNVALGEKDAAARDAAFEAYLAGLQHTAGIARSLIADSQTASAQASPDTALLLAAQSHAFAERSGGLVEPGDVRAAIVGAQRSSPGLVGWLRGLPGPITAVAMSPDGTRAAGVSEPYVAVWSVADRRRLDIFPMPDGTVDWQVHFVNADLLVMANDDGDIWYRSNADGSKWTRVRSHQPGDWITDVARTGHDRLLVTRSNYDRTATKVEVYDSQGKEVSCPRRFDDFEVDDAALSSSGRSVALLGMTGSSGGVLKTFPVGCGRPTSVPLEADPIGMRFSRDGNAIVLLNAVSSEVLRINPRSGTTTVVPGWTDLLRATDVPIALSPTGTAIVQRIDSAHIGIGLKRDGEYVTGLAAPLADASWVDDPGPPSFSANGRFLITAGSDGAIPVFDLAGVAASPDASLTHTRSFAPPLICGRLDFTEEGFGLPSQCGASAALSPDGTVLARLGTFHAARKLELAWLDGSNRVEAVSLPRLPAVTPLDLLDDHCAPFCSIRSNSLAFSSSGAELAVANRGGSVDIFDVGRGDLIGHLTPPDRAHCISIDCEVKVVFAGSLDVGRVFVVHDGKVWFWALDHGEVVESGPIAVGAIRVSSIASDRSGERLAVFSENASFARVLDAVGGHWRESRSLRVSGADGLALSPDGHQLVLPGSELQSFDLDGSGKAWRQPSSDIGIWFDGVGDLYTLSADFGLRRRSATDGQLKLSFSGVTGVPTAITADRDQVAIAAISSDSLTGRYRVITTSYDLALPDLVADACARAGRNLTHAEWAQHVPSEPYESTCPRFPPGP